METPDDNHPDYASRVFAHFHPLESSLLEEPEFCLLQPAALRARALLKSRTAGEIHEAANFLDSLRIQLEANVNQVALEHLHTTIDTEYPVSVALALHLYMPKIDLIKESPLDKPFWPEHFAILALAKIGEAVRIARIPWPFADLAERPDPHAHIPSYAMDALEAICYAESLAGNLGSEASLKTMLDQAVASNSRKQRKAAAETRHAPARAIKDRFVELVDRGTFPSVREAARKFYQALSEEERRALCPSLKEENATRNLTDYYRENSS